MKKYIYLVKETTVIGNEFDSMEVYPFINENEGLKFVEKQIKDYINDYDEDSDIDFCEDGFESIIWDNEEDTKILYSVDVMHIEGDKIPEEIYVYTEVNTYASGEICPHAVGCLTKSDAVYEMVSEINNRADADMDDNFYWVSDGSVTKGYVELEDENGNISYLDYSRMPLASNN